MYLETKYAQVIVGMLEDAQDIGMCHVVLQLQGKERGLEPNDILFFDTAGAALEYLDDIDDRNHYLPGDTEFPVYYMHVDRLLEGIKEQNQLIINEVGMNYNNLENLKGELTKLGFGKKVIEEMQKQMEKGVPEFTVYDRVMGTAKQVDLTLHFKQSGQSENYYFNKFNVALNNGKPLEEGQKYRVISPNLQEPGKNLVRSFENVTEAIAYFKEQKGDSKLVVGKDAAHSTELARMEKGSVNYVEKDFAYPYKHPARTQTFFVERGKGFSAEQAVNLIQGRAVYRDDLVSTAGQYKAWVKLDMDTAKDRYQNYTTLQYHVPTYGFELEKVLDKYGIKELDNDKKRGTLIHSLQNGNRPLVTVTKEGQETRLAMEVQPRYSQLNFFREQDGKPEKREQFLKEQQQGKKMEVAKGKGQAKQQAQGMEV